MGRFMLAVLGDGSVDGSRVLSPASVRMMLAPQYAPHPRIPATTYGFAQLESHRRLLLYRGGSTGEQAAMVLLFPDARLGVFVASNFAALSIAFLTFLNYWKLLGMRY